MEKCTFCMNDLKVFKTVSLISGEKICSECKENTKKELGLGLFDGFKYSLEEIYSMYKDKGIDLKETHDNRALFLDEVEQNEESFSRFIRIVGGGNLIDTPEYSHIYQLKDGRVYFKNNFIDFFYLLSIEFAGPRFKSVTTESSQESVNADTLEKTKKKGKSGKVAAGAVIGTMIAPGLGTVVGAYAGGKGKDKKKKKTSQKIDTKSRATSTTQEVEEKSTCTLKVERISDRKILSIIAKVDSEGFYELSSGMETKTELGLEEKVRVITSEEAITKLKELKELVDIGILSESEFDEKKVEYLKLI